MTTERPATSQRGSILALITLLVLTACGRIVEPIPCGPANADASEDYGTHVVYFCKP